MEDVKTMNFIQLVKKFEEDKFQQILNLFPDPDFLNVGITAYFDFSDLDDQIREIYPFFNLDNLFYTNFKLRAPDRATILELYKSNIYEQGNLRAIIMDPESPENYNPQAGRYVNFVNLEWEHDVKHRKFKAIVTPYEVSVEYFGDKPEHLEHRLNEIIEGTDGRLVMKPR